MTDRPPISADLRRQVLLEAGHRCAIHTCRHVDVDVHHIVPWAQRPEHRFDNLIALCPNCHRRAEKGDIDRKSLRAYKARLAAAFRFQEVNQYPEEVVLPAGFGWLDPSGMWATKTLTTRLGSIDVGIEYPHFGDAVLGDAATSVNERILSHVETSVKTFAEATQGIEPIDTGAAWYFQGSFAVSLANAHLISVRFTLTSYTGGVHEATWTESVNLQTHPIRSLAIENLFSDSAAGMRLLSDYAITQLLIPRDGQTRDEQWVKTGAGPDPTNFTAFNLTSRGVLLTFDAYQVGSYAEGPSEIHVPFSTCYRLIEPSLASELPWHDA